ncbi:hypothetical protein IQ07DRAFT_628806 [Pyrenochaeta sp. DS3sAY3a]|nr:hypothetical protein IQ07DRAFT_628806 [Pyrenochaeta sp. DS3sAY3a]
MVGGAFLLNKRFGEISVPSNSIHDEGPSSSSPVSVPATAPSHTRVDTLPEYRDKATQTRMAAQDEEDTVTARLYSAIETPLEILSGQGRVAKEQKAMILMQRRMIQEHQDMLREEQITLRAQKALIEQQRTQFLHLQKEHNALLEAIAKLGAPFQQQPRPAIPTVSKNPTKPRKRPIPSHVIVYINEVRDRLQAALNKAKAELELHGGIDKARMIDLVHIQRSLTSKVDGAAISKERVEKDASFDANLLKTRLEPLENDITCGRRLLEAISQRSLSRLNEPARQSTARDPTLTGAQILVKQECDDDALATTSTTAQDPEIKQEPEDMNIIILSPPDISNVTGKRPGEPQESATPKKMCLQIRCREPDGREP